ncbi:MAG: hypothetical protein OXT09_31120 [Myxococcales bacterium]|nr:hypothetical protein [Myxococcales bacterium]
MNRSSLVLGYLVLFALPQVAALQGCDPTDGADTPGDGDADDGDGDAGNRDDDAGDGTGDGDGREGNATSGTTLDGIERLSLGGFGACAVLQGGEAACWGPLPGLEGPERLYGAVAIPGLAGVIDVDVGHAHACAVLEDGTVWCWGENDSGQLGNGITETSGVPVQVLGIDTGIGVMAAQRHSCAVLADGTARCWGSNRFADLGDGSYGQPAVPVPRVVLGLADAEAIAGWVNSTCAVRNGGQVSCWGIFGNPLEPGIEHFEDLPPVSTIVTHGQDSVCTLLRDGSVRCGLWTDPAASEIAVPGEVSQLRGGEGDYCAVNAEGEAWYWGKRRSPWIEPGIAGPITEPERVPADGRVLSCDLNGQAICVIREQGDVICWGRNFDGELGVPPFESGADRFAHEENPSAVRWTTGTPNWVMAPTASTATAGLLRDVSALGSGCFLMSAGTVQCISRNDDENSHAETVPIVERTEVIGLDNVAELADSCARRADGSVWCWSRNDWTATPLTVDGITSLSGSAEFGCAVNGAAQVVCWGDNYPDGQAGQPPEFGNPPVPPSVVPGVGGAVAVRTSSNHACALLESGSVMCWGKPETLGANAGMGSHGPFEVTGITDAVGLALALDYSCAMHAGGTVSCWGERFDRVHPIDPPEAVAGFEAAVQIDLWGDTLCARRSDGVVHCAATDYRTLGRTLAWNDYEPYDPIEIPGIVGATDVRDGCVLMDQGTVQCWSGGAQETQGLTVLRSAVE